jgi:hypothetical protein
MTPLTPAVAQKIEALFPPESREAVSTHDGRAVWCRPSSIHAHERLRQEIEGAHIDWRDTLMAAGFGEDIHAHLKWNPIRPHER